MSLRLSFARWCRSTRLDLDITQQQLADSIGVSRAYVARLEGGRANPSLEVVDRIGTALGIDFELTGRSPIVWGGRGASDAVHARCSAYAHRRLLADGLMVAREVQIRDGRGVGWIDLLACDPRTGRLLIVEVKTSIDDIGRLERQVGWYERLAIAAARDRGWTPRWTSTWVLLLATTQNDATVTAHADLFRHAFPLRAASMRAGATDGPADGGRGIALIDPARRRRDWLIALHADGRRSPLPYPDRAAAGRIILPPPRRS
jgi:transcriptional regulator with XRE-family HTH domain